MTIVSWCALRFLRPVRAMVLGCVSVATAWRAMASRAAIANSGTMDCISRAQMARQASKAVPFRHSALLSLVIVASAQAHGCKAVSRFL